jgi:hypothetical protein
MVSRRQKIAAIVIVIVVMLRGPWLSSLTLFSTGNLTSQSIMEIT